MNGTKMTEIAPGAFLAEMALVHKNGYEISVRWSDEDDAWIARAKTMRFNSGTGEVMAHGATQINALMELACALCSLADCLDETIDLAENSAASRLSADAARLEAEHAQLLRFAGRAIQETRTGDIGDWDGGDLQEAMTHTGLLGEITAIAPCGEHCPCAEFARGETTCYRLTDLGTRALDSVSTPVREVDGRDTGWAHHD